MSLFSMKHPTTDGDGRGDGGVDDVRAAGVFVDRPNEFVENIYETTLGTLRVDQLVSDLQKLLVRFPKLRHLVDIGAGTAPVTLELLRRHSELSATLVDPSGPLLLAARRESERLGVASRVTFHEKTFDAVEDRPSEFAGDLFLCHAVANWTPAPLAFIRRFVRHVQSQHAVGSLVVGARPGKVLRFASQGRLRDALGAAIQDGPVASLIPGERVWPVDPGSVVRTVRRLKCSILTRAGVRVLADLIPSQAIEGSDARNALASVEAFLRSREPYWRMGQLIHLIFRGTDSDDRQLPLFRS